jgi:hypothetical protein
MANLDLFRVSATLTILLTMTGWEIIAPKRKLTTGKGRRWTTNLSMIGLDSLLVRLLLPVTAVQIALAAQAGQWGLLNQVIFRRSLPFCWQWQPWIWPFISST